MKIVKCTKCKKYIHKANKCFYCGNTMGFEDVEIPAIHENVVTEYSKIESLIENKKFAEAYSLSHTVVEWMPTLSSIFWLRLLAKNKCVNTTELIRKGFDCEKDADFSNAVTFSNGAEHNIYQEVYRIVLAIQKTLHAEILKHESQCKLDTNILQIKEKMTEKIDAHQHKLFVLWTELEKTEQSIYTLEKDCNLLAKEYVNDLDKAVQKASALKEETYRLEKCTDDNFHKFHVKIYSILQQSEQAKVAIENIKVHNPLIETFNNLVKQRDEQISQITNELSSLRNYEAEIQCILDKIDQIEQRHRIAIHAVKTFDFVDAANLLGKNSYNAILQNIGLDI